MIKYVLHEAIGKLRDEMEVDFIELEKQLYANQEMLDSISNPTGKMANIMNLFSDKIKKVFVIIEEALDSDPGLIDSEISDTKDLLDHSYLQ